MSHAGRLIRQRLAPPFKDPWDPAYFGRKEDGSGATDTQLKIRDDFRAKKGARVASIGAKGSAKSLALSGMHLVEVAQKYPGCKYGIVANSYAQAYGSGAEKLVKVAQTLNIRFIFRTEMTIDGVRHYNVYYFPDYDSKVCVLSFDQMALIEGTEWDGFSFEEIQDCEMLPVQTAISRVRRTYGDHSFAASGMPDDESHWMYEWLPRWEFSLYEPSVYENEKNLPVDYIPNLKALYTGLDFERYVDGHRVALFRNRVFHNFRYSMHVGSEQYSLLTAYDPALPLVIVFDFNLSPMCAAVFQRKKMAGREIWAQIDEFEAWGSGTEGICGQILEEYGVHQAGGTILGDSSGNARDTRTPGRTDWGIIGYNFANLGLGFTIIRGLRQSVVTQKQISEVHYSNPPVKETIVCANRMLLDGEGNPGVVFLPRSRFESGGLAKSVGAMQARFDGVLDKSPDKRPGRNVVRTHFADIFRYFAFWAEGSMVEQRRRWAEIGQNPRRHLGKFRLPW